MIATDTSSLRRFFDGEIGADTDVITRVLDAGEGIILPPVVLTEVLSDHLLPPSFVREILKLPLLEILDGYWRRAGEMRARLRMVKLKAMVPDCLIAQSCIDHDIPLIAHDRDFRHFVSAGLTLL